MQPYRLDFRQLTLLTAIVVVLLAALSLPGCAAISGPTKAAQTSEQKAFAMYGTFVVFEELGAAMVNNPNVPPDIRRGIVSADQRAKPFADNLLAATLEVRRIRTALAAGSSSAERLRIATDNLNLWINNARGPITGLVTAVHSGRSID